MSPINLNFLSRILIVDNDAVSRATVSLMLSGEGYHVSQAANSEQAIAQFRQRPFDLVITELNLDGKDGIQIIKELRQEQPHTNFIVMVQGGCMPSDFCQQMAEHFGVRSVFTKPFPPEQILPAVRASLG
ncbi:MAG: response regulator [Verrucomicrobiota bacterium]|jgi:CheY-like chemotaxis protein